MVLSKMFETIAKYQYYISICQNLSGMMMRSSQLIISIKLVTDNFEYAILSANRLHFDSWGLEHTYFLFLGLMLRSDTI